MAKRESEASIAPADPPSGQVLAADFFARETVDVARDLLGKVLIRQIDGWTAWGRVVEVEAYLAPDDLASHAARGRRTQRNEVMYGDPGHSYVYFTYGMHFCLCFVTREAGVPQAVLVRALEPGAEVGRCSGPGLVCRALKIDRSVNGLPLRPPDIYVVDDGAPRGRIFATPRIGIGGSGFVWERRLLRYCLDSPHLSRPLPKKKRRGA